MTGYDAAQRVARDNASAATGVNGLSWIDGGRAFEYDRGGKRYRYDIGRRRASEIDTPPPADTGGGGRGRGSGVDAPERGRQFESTT